MAFCLSKNYSYLCYMGNWEERMKKESRKEINPAEKTQVLICPITFDQS